MFKGKCNLSTPKPVPMGCFERYMKEHNIQACISCVLFFVYSILFMIC
jgi:hypothetical protein